MAYGNSAIITSEASYFGKAPRISFGGAGRLGLGSGNDSRRGSSASSVVQLLLDGGRGMVARLCEVGCFLRRLRVQIRFGDLSRAPLQLLRLELLADSAECEWIARPADHWDAELASGVAERNTSTQALTDAIRIRELLFLVLPNLRSAAVRVYRQAASENLRLIIKGTVTPEQRVSTSVRSLAMRAKLFGLDFRLNDGVLEDLPTEQSAASLHPARMQKDKFEDRAVAEGGRRPLF